MLTESAYLEDLTADATDKTKICHNKISPSIFLRQLQFCRLVQIGPKSCKHPSQCLAYGHGTREEQDSKGLFRSVLLRTHTTELYRQVRS